MKGKKSKIVSGVLIAYMGMLAMASQYQFADASSAQVSVMSWALYDSGGHIDYSNKKSKYFSMIEAGAKTWNDHHRGVFRKDTSKTTNDLTISDFSRANNICATTYDDGAIQFNRTVMETLTYSRKRCVATHEMGHALGVGHIKKTTDVMYPVQNTHYSLSVSDMKSYDASYRKFNG